MNDAGGGDCPQRPNRENNRNWIGRRIDNIQSYFQNRRAKKKEQTPVERAALSTSWATWVSAIFTFAVVVVGVFQYYTFKKQLSVMQGQLDALETDQRPWLQPKMQLVGFRFTKDGDAEITYFLDYWNVGKSPARNIFSRVVAVIQTHENAIKSTDDERAQCDLARKDSENRVIQGIFLFPGQSAHPLIGGVGVGRAYVTSTEYSKAWPGPDKLLFKVVGCIDYSYSKDGRIHGGSGFAYSVSKRLAGAPNIPTFFSPATGEIPVDQIIFKPDPFSSGTIE